MSEIFLNISSICQTMIENSGAAIFLSYFLLSIEFRVPLNSGKYRPWMLVTILFPCCTCITPGTFFFVSTIRDSDLKELRNVRLSFVLRVSIMGIYERKLYVSLPCCRQGSRE